MTERSKIYTVGNLLETKLQEFGVDIEYGAHSDGKLTITDMVEALTNLYEFFALVDHDHGNININTDHARALRGQKMLLENYMNCILILKSKAITLTVVF